MHKFCNRVTFYMEGASIVWENEVQCLIYLRGRMGGIKI